MLKLCWKTHICVGNSTYVWGKPHTFGFNHILVGILWPVCFFFIKYLRHVEMGWEQQHIGELCYSLWFLMHWPSVWSLVDLWQPDRMEGVITSIRFRSNRQPLEKFKSFPTGISQEDIMKETKGFFSHKIQQETVH